MRWRLSVLALAICALGTAHCAPAVETYPDHPITIVMGASKGGIIDVVTRAYADVIAKDLRQTVLVDNRPSETGEEAAVFVQHAAPDGYTLLAFQGAQHLALAQLKPVPYEPLTGFTPVTTLFTLANFLAVPAGSPAITARDLLKLGERRGLTFGSSGMATVSHLTASRMTLDFGKHIAPALQHYAGAAPMIADLVAERFDFAFVSYAVAAPYVRDGKLRLLAVDAETRWPDLPQLPTLREAGIYQVKVASWFALAAPKATPPALVEKLYESFARAGRDPTLLQALRDNGVLPASATPAETRVMMVDEAANIAVLVASLNPQIPEKENK